MLVMLGASTVPAISPMIENGLRRLGAKADKPATVGRAAMMPERQSQRAVATRPMARATGQAILLRKTRLRRLGPRAAVRRNDIMT